MFYKNWPCFELQSSEKPTCRSPSHTPQFCVLESVSLSTEWDTEPNDLWTSKVTSKSSDPLGPTVDEEEEVALHLHPQEAPPSCPLREKSETGTVNAFPGWAAHLNDRMGASPPEGKARAGEVRNV